MNYSPLQTQAIRLFLEAARVQEEVDVPPPDVMDPLRIILAGEICGYRRGFARVLVPSFHGIGEVNVVGLSLLVATSCFLLPLDLSIAMDIYVEASPYLLEACPDCCEAGLTLVHEWRRSGRHLGVLGEYLRDTFGYGSRRGRLDLSRLNLGARVEGRFTRLDRGGLPSEEDNDHLIMKMLDDIEAREFRHHREDRPL